MSERETVWHLTQWLADGSPRSWTIQARIPEGRYPAIHDHVDLTTRTGWPVKAEVTNVIISDDGDRVLVFAEVGKGLRGRTTEE